MRNGVEYSKSKNYRIVKREHKNEFTGCKCIQYHVEKAEYRLNETTWMPCKNGPWDYLNSARGDIYLMENPHLGGWNGHRQKLTGEPVCPQ